MNILERLVIVIAGFDFVLRALPETNHLRKLPGTSAINRAKAMNSTFSMERYITVVKCMGN